MTLNLVEVLFYFLIGNAQEKICRGQKRPSVTLYLIVSENKYQETETKKEQTRKRKQQKST